MLNNKRALSLSDAKRSACRQVLRFVFYASLPRCLVTFSKKNKAPRINRALL
jgi:hypothetical protein